MTVLGMQINAEGARHGIMAVLGLAGGTFFTFVHDHESGIMFVAAMCSYGLAATASILHIRKLRKK